MNVRFGIIFLLVAMVFAIGQVSSEEAEAETMVRREAESRRSADPLKAAALIAALKKRLGRSADPGKVSVHDFLAAMQGRKGRKAERSPSADPDPGMLDFMKDLPFIGGLMG